jgi:glycosyltransferase involved in cell wall biosynthesis
LSPLISIIIPTRNRAKILARCLDALVLPASGDRSLEIIVVDDCSTDGTLQVVRGFAQKSGKSVQLLCQQHPSGANAARNRALQIARGETIVFLDDDVIVPEGWLEALLEGLSKSGCPVVSGAVRLTVEGAIIGKHREEIGTYLSEVLVPPKGVKGETIPVACNMAAWRWVFDRARFDESIRPPV